LFLFTTYFLNCSTNQTTQIEELSGDLAAHIDNIVRQMPGRASEGFVKPTAGQLNNWHDLVILFLDGNLREVQSIIDTEFPFYRLLRYKDTGIDDRIYYVLEENLPVRKGWGTYVLNPSAQFVFKVHIPYMTSIHLSRRRKFSDVPGLFFLCWQEPTDALIPNLHNVMELFEDAVRIGIRFPIWRILLHLCSRLLMRSFPNMKTKSILEHSWSQSS